MVTFNKQKKSTENFRVLGHDSRKMSSKQALDRRLSGYLGRSERGGIDKIAYSLGNQTQGFRSSHKAVTGTRCCKIIAITRQYIAAIRQ